MEAVAIDDAKVRIVTDLYIGGRRVAGAGGKPCAIHNPFDNSEICRIAPASADRSMRRSRRPRRPSGRRRGKGSRAASGACCSIGWRRCCGATSRRSPLLESMDTGIPIRETRMEVTTSAIHLEYFAGLAGSIEGTYQDLGARFNYTRREPFGVIGQIVPWNTPLKLMARGFSAAIACGNTMVIKPSIVAPLSILRSPRSSRRQGFRRAPSTSSPARGAPSAGTSSSMPRCARSSSRAAPKAAGRSSAGRADHQAGGAGAGRQGTDHRLRADRLGRGRSTAC